MTWTVYWTLNLRRLPTLIISALFTGYPECLPPAPIISLNSDSDSALPTLCLKLVFEFRLSDLHFVLLKPHMDPHASDSALHILTKIDCNNYKKYTDLTNEVNYVLLKKLKNAFNVSFQDMMFTVFCFVLLRHTFLICFAHLAVVPIYLFFHSINN